MTEEPTGYVMWTGPFDIRSSIRDVTP